jgi:hypothetical protein
VKARKAKKFSLTFVISISPVFASIKITFPATIPTVFAKVAEPSITIKILEAFGSFNVVAIG